MAKEGLRDIEVGSDLRLPASEAATQTLGAIAAKGGGKSYLASKIAEGLFDAGAPFLVLDPVGNWSALTLAKDGKSPGLSVVVIGGERADVPLDEEAAEFVAATLIDKGISAVLDISELSKARRKTYVAVFCESLFRAARKKKRPHMVIFEEAQTFAPQQCPPGEQRMLGAVTDIVRLGRNHGLGSMMVSQRPQSVSKEVLNQIECLFVGQLRGPQERKAIKGWVQEQGLASINVDQLPKLEVGEFYCWSPSWLSVFRKIKVAPKRTFDGSSTPTLGALPAAARRVDRKSVEEAVALLATLGAEIEDSTPHGIVSALDSLEPDARASMAALQAVNDKLEAENEALSVKVEKLEEQNTEAWERIYRADEDLKDLEQQLRDMADSLTAVRERLAEHVTEGPAPTGEDMAAERITRCAVARTMEARATERRPEGGVLRAVQSGQAQAEGGASLKLKLGRGALYGEKALDKADRTILDVLVWQKAPVSKRKLALLAGYAASGGGFNNALGRLRKAGRIEGSALSMVITAEGRKLAHRSSMPAPGSPLFEWWTAHPKVDGCMRAILHALRGAGKPLHPDALAVASGYTPKTGGFGNGLGRLRTLGLVEGKGKTPVSLAKELR
jgi:hypothetical protein